MIFSPNANALILFLRLQVCCPVRRCNGQSYTCAVVVALVRISSEFSQRLSNSTMTTSSVDVATDSASPFTLAAPVDATERRSQLSNKDSSSHDFSPSLKTAELERERQARAALDSSRSGRLTMASAKVSAVSSLLRPGVQPSFLHTTFPVNGSKMATCGYWFTWKSSAYTRPSTATLN